MAGLKVLSPRQVDTAKFKTVREENGTPCREFEVGSLVKKELTAVDRPGWTQFGGDVFGGGSRRRHQKRGAKAKRGGEDGGARRRGERHVRLASRDSGVPILQN